MPNVEPPERPPQEPEVCLLPEGADLCRLYRVRFGPLSFNSAAATNPYKGGRFDSPDGSYTYMYCASTPSAAVAETLLRYVPGSGVETPTIVHEKNIVGSGLVRIETCRPLQLIDLTGQGFHKIGQTDDWLTSCEADQYPQTRHWANALREWVPEAHGLKWRARHDNNEFAFVLFGDRLTADTLRRQSVRLLSSPSGRVYLEELLAEYGAVVE